MESLSCLRVGIILFLSVFLVSPVYSGLAITMAYTYWDTYDLRIPADADETKGWMNDAILEVPDHITIADLDLNIFITHTQVFDLQIFLQSPSQTRMLINMYDPFTEFFEGENYTDTTFDDEALIAIEDAEPPFTGRFRPRDPGKLAIFDGEDAFGQWRLQVYDAFAADSGKLTYFGLSIITVPEPTTILILSVGSILAVLKRRSGR
jgi:subtilisin-like proprotein convertase family protein